MIASNFFYVGQFIAWSVIHEGVGLCGLSRPIVEYLVNGIIEAALPFLTTDDIVNETVKEVLYKVSQVNCIKLCQINDCILFKNANCLFLCDLGRVIIKQCD